MVQYVNVKFAVDPAVTAAAVISTVAGEQTAAGFVIVKVGNAFKVAVTLTFLVVAP